MPTQGVVNEVERLATQPEVVLVFDVQPGPRYLFGAARRSSSSDNPAPVSRRRARPASAWSRASRRGPSPCSTPSRSCSTDARKAGFALAALRRARRHRRSRHPAHGRHAAARAGPAGRLRRGHLHRWRRHRLRLPAWPRADRGRGSATIPTLVDEGQKRLFDTNLFSTIVIQPADAADGRRTGSTSPTTCSQRPPRSIGAELDYQTDLGPGSQAVLGASQRLRRRRALPRRGLASRSRSSRLTLEPAPSPTSCGRDQNLLTEATAPRERLGCL